MTAIIRLKRQLLTTARLHFRSRPASGSRTDWSGEGEGSVTVEQQATVIRFQETGVFRLAHAGAEARQVAFRNSYRWTFFDDRVSLHHERRGPDAAVWLFDLVVDDATSFVNADPHVCIDDLYTARLVLDDTGFTLDWKIVGPRKNERLHYRYHSAAKPDTAA